MYPIKFHPLYFEKIWGGRDFEKFREQVPEGSIGESWDIASHPNGMSVVANGIYTGMRLDELIHATGEELLGTKMAKGKFPLLVKLINANHNLSVQVHPNDEYAQKAEGGTGKTEAWYVVDAQEGASLIVGFKESFTRSQFLAAMEQGNLEQHLNRIPVKAGDIFLIPSGLVHAIGEGITLAEIQQNSDITYRVYDYNRGRELHIEKALDVIDFTLAGTVEPAAEEMSEGYRKRRLCSTPHFCIELYDVTESCTETSDIERFSIWTCIDGRGEIQYGPQGERTDLRKGDSVLIPASLGQYTITGVKCIKSYVP